MADLGKVAIRPKGKYIVGTAYEMLDLVEYEGSSYLSIKDTAITPADDGINWMLIAKKGIDDIATTDLTGVVKPDGITITIDKDGTLHGASQVPEGVTYVKFEGPEVPPEEESPVNPVPEDADTLGGNPPEYYASAGKVEELKAAINEIAGNLGEISNDNIIINPDFSINQRGQETYTCVNYTYTADRWATHYNTTVNVKEKGVQISVNNAGGGIYQRIDNFEKYRGKTVALSVEISNIQMSIQEGVMLKLVIHDGINGGESNVTGTGITHLTYTISDNATRLLVYVLYTKNGASSGAEIGNTTADIEWIKLEEGTKNTKFMPPSFAGEIKKCRYFYCELAGKYPITTERNGGLYTHTSFESMRVNPTIRLKNNDINTTLGFSVINMGSGTVAGGFAFDATAYNNKYMQINATKANHGLDYKQYMISAHENYLCLDAEMY